MTIHNRPPAPAGNLNTWAERLNDWLIRNRSKLAYYLGDESAHDDGILLWDADNSRVVVSKDGSWEELGTGGGGTITNYLRDDADDSTDFRLTMGGLTVDTDTLYVDSVSSEVGIGTTDPSEKLEVVGNVEATEFIGDLRGAVVFKAKAGEALTKGDVVYISGIDGNTTVVSKADADAAAKMPAFGLAAKTVGNNAALEVYTFGTLSNIDTSSYSEGDELFVSTTAGALTDTAPTGEGSLVQKIGKVTRSHASSGSIKIMGAGRTNATPNLNDGNIFIGNASNEATTASLATQVTALETSHDDVLVDGDFTSNGFMKRTGEGTYTVDTNTYLTAETSHADVVVDGDFTSEGLMRRGATDGSYSIVTDNSSNWNTAYSWGNHASAGYLTSIADGSITTAKLGNQSVTGAKIAANTVGSGNLADNSVYTAAIADNQVTFSKLSDVKDEDDMVSNSATHIATQQSIKAYIDSQLLKKETQFCASNNALSKALTTTSTTMWTEFDVPSYTDKQLHTAKFQLVLQSGSSTYRNDGIFYVEAQVPSGTTSYSLGTATFSSAPSTYVAIVRVDGDVTDKLTAGGSIGLNSDSSGYFADRSVRAFYYDNALNYTFIEYSSYPSQIVSSGTPREIFFDPFHWTSDGTYLILEQYDFDIPYTSQHSMLNIETRLGYFNQATHYRLRARELSSGDTLTVQNMRHTLKTRKI